MNLTGNVARVALIAGVTLAVGCALHPIHNRILQTGLAAGVALVWVGLFELSSNHKRLRVALLISPWLVLLPFAMPGKAMDPDRLRADYVNRLLRFEDTRYVWGGESPRGIDCSGLPRRALRDALWTEGWHHANGTAFRMWWEQWCFDSSAKAMGQGYRGRTASLGVSGPLWKLDPSQLLPGDLAIRADGVHVVVYLGNRLWIEADPGRGKVRSWISSPEDGAWYEPMTVHRWVAVRAPAA